MARYTTLALILFFCATPGRAHAQPAPTSAQAADRYAVLLKTRGPDADLLYNLGTAAADAGEWGRAVWALERARLFAPRDPDLLHNLDVVRQRVRVERMKNLTSARLTDGEPDGAAAFRAATAVSPWAAPGAVLLASLLFTALLAARARLRPGGAQDTAAVLAGLAALTALACLAAGAAQLVTLDTLRLGVVLNPDQRIASTPSATADARAHADLYPGAIVRVLDARSDGWTHIRLVDGTAGWVRAADVGLIQAAEQP